MRDKIVIGTEKIAVSGNFQRPGFLEMLEDARHGLINLILVKDAPDI